jgi:hypothetical protein
LAVAAQQCADLCRGIVGDVSTPMRPGERIRKARRTRLQTLSIVDLAVLAELSEGRSWDEIAAALAMDESAARATYEPVWEQWQAGEYDGPDFGDFAVGSRNDPDLPGTAAFLDSWWVRHAEPWDAATTGRPVSQVLVDGQSAPGDR